MQPKHVQLKPTCATMTINHHMAMIQVHIDKNFIDDVLIDGGSRINIITENLRVQLGLSKTNPTLYNLRIVDQTIAKLLGLIKDLKVFLTLLHLLLLIVMF